MLSRRSSRFAAMTNGNAPESGTACQSSMDNHSNGSGSIGTPEAKGSITSRSEVNYPAIDSQSRLICESKNRNRKIIRFMTVIAYIFFVSLGAIVLSLYYFFIWVPRMQLGPFPDPNAVVGPGGSVHSFSSGSSDPAYRAGRKRGQVHHLVQNQQEAQISGPQFSPDDNPRWRKITSEATQSQSELHNELPTRSSVYSLISKKRLPPKNTPSTQEPAISTNIGSKPP